MGAFIAKQPNGLYCRFSSITDCPSDWNMTREDYIQLCVNRAVDEANNVLDNHLYPFEKVIQDFFPNNMSEKEFQKFLSDTNKERGDESVCKKCFYY